MASKILDPYQWISDVYPPRLTIAIIPLRAVSIPFLLIVFTSILDESFPLLVFISILVEWFPLRVKWIVRFPFETSLDPDPIVDVR